MNHWTWCDGMLVFKVIQDEKMMAFWNEISIFELTSPTLIDNIERTKLKFIENSSFLISLHYTYNKSLSWKVLYTLECSSCRTIFIICQQIALNTSLHQFIHTLFSIYFEMIFPWNFKRFTKSFDLICY